MSRVFDWNDLTFFLEVARQGRLMPAARKLKVDHTTVGRRITELERSLAAKIFDRKPEGFVLTDNGQKLLQIAERIEGLALSINENLRSAPAEFSGRVRLATMEGIASYFLSEKLVDFNVAHPRIVIELVTERHLINMTKREADVCVSFVPLAAPRLIVKQVGEFRLGLFASTDYLQRKGTPRSLLELRDHDFVDYVDDLVVIHPVQWLHDVLVPDNVVFRSTSMASQQNAVAAGRGVGLLPYFSAKRDARLIPLLKDTVSVTRSIFVSVHQELEYLGRIRALVRFLNEVFRSSSPELNEI